MMSSATTTVLSSLPNDHAATLADLMQAVSYTRHAETAAKRARERADYELMAYLEGIGETSVHSDELHIRATVTRRRTAKLADERACALALNEIGLVIPRKEMVDTSELLAIADRFGGDFPGVEISETESLRVTGDRR